MQQQKRNISTDILHRDCEHYLVRAIFVQGRRSIMRCSGRYQNIGTTRGNLTKVRRLWFLRIRIAPSPTQRWTHVSCRRNMLLERRTPFVRGPEMQSKMNHQHEHNRKFQIHGKNRAQKTRNRTMEGIIQLNHDDMKTQTFSNEITDADMTI